MVRRWERSTVRWEGWVRKGWTGRGKEFGKDGGKKRGGRPEKENRRILSMERRNMWQRRAWDSRFVVANDYETETYLLAAAAEWGPLHVVFVLAGMTAHGPVGVHDYKQQLEIRRDALSPASGREQIVR